MNVPEVFGYIASGLVLATFSMRTMIPLRILGISSNIAFITYGALAGLLPVLILHSILLPLNIYRFFEMWRLIQEVENAVGDDHALKALLPYTKSVNMTAGSTLFQKGDKADDMYILTAGKVRLPELDAEVGAGETIGEIGMFSPATVRMATAVCAEDCRLQRITRKGLHELVYQNPRVGFHLIGVITARLLEDVQLMQSSMAKGSGVAQ